MDDYDHGKAADERSRIRNLTRSNQDAWFRRIKIKLKGKSLLFVIEQTVDQYAWIKKAEDTKATGTPGTNTTTESGSANKQENKEMDDLALQFERLGGTWNVEKKQAYDVAEARALDIVLQSLDGDDQALYDDYEIAVDFWTALKVKYSKPSDSIAVDYQTAIIGFVYKEKRGLAGNWAEMREFRRKIVNANPIMKHAYPDEALYKLFVGKLPEEYKATIDSVKPIKSYSVEDKLQYLYEAEAQLRPQIDSDDEEAAHIARANRGRNRGHGNDNGRGSRRQNFHQQQSHHRNNSGSYSDVSDHSDQGTCYLCESKSSYHPWRHCPYLKFCKQQLQALWEKRRAKAKVSTSTKSPKTIKSGKDSKDSKDSKTDHKTGKKKRAYAANSNDHSGDDDLQDLDSEIESVGFSASDIRKANPSSWPTDTGASSHMSDQPSLFRCLEHCRSKRIKVGGGD